MHIIKNLIIVFLLRGRATMIAFVSFFPFAPREIKTFGSNAISAIRSLS